MNLKQLYNLILAEDIRSDSAIWVRNPVTNESFAIVGFKKDYEGDLVLLLDPGSESEYDTFEDPIEGN